MRNFGPYEALEQVAVGATGTLYRARHTEIDRVVAVKELSPALHAVPGLLERFRGEARVLATLDDPHVVAVYDYVEEPDRAWIAEEWVPGASLREILAARHRLAPEQALGAVRGALMGLAHAHGRGLLHRDISTGNVLADLAGESKLVDFGLAAPSGETGVLGTPAFVSPEAIRGEALGTQSDVYSAGAVLHLLLSGQPPFPATTPVEALRRHLEDAPPHLTGHGRELGAVITRCLAKDPADRPADAAALLAELEEAAERRYGAAWTTRASIAALVVATMEAKPAGSPTTHQEPTETTGAIDTGRATRVIRTPPRAAKPVAGATVAAASAPVAPAPVRQPEHQPHHKRRARRVSPLVVAAAALVVLAGAATAATVALTGGDTASSTPSPVSEVSPAASPSPSVEPSPTPEASPSTSPSPAPLLAAAAPQGTFTIAVTVVKSTNAFEPAGTVLRATWTVVTTCARTAHATINGLRPPVFTFGSPCTGTVTSTTGARYTSTWDGTTIVTKGTRESPCLNRSSGTPVPGTAGAYHEVIVNTLTVTKRTADGRPAELRGTGQQTQTLTKGFPTCVAGTTAESRTLVVVLQ
ncbi:MAG: eukaryotic-like serine/threonine-protein kinase [Actinomycetota bacterium]|jgi:serine/threonine-protein kinase|nr:eukaryotic-like serine/threonine-protein kinase [Actinomycetota bacterium]